MNKDDVKTAFARAGISRLLKDLDLITQQSIRLSASPAEEANLSLGASKLGGSPDMLPGMIWPLCKGVPQSFIAQVNLAEVGENDPGRVLPQGGMLWFFYDARQETYGADPSDRGGWSVLYKQPGQENTARLQRATPPATLPSGSIFKACSVKFRSEITLSHSPQLDIPNFDWTDEEVKKYENLLSTFPDSADRGTFHHRLLGFPDTIQDDMRVECQLASNGISDANDPRAAELSKGALDWQLLLQIDSDDRAGMRWGDAGMLYYWIRKADLQRKDFDDTWLVLQSD